MRQCTATFVLVLFLGAGMGCAGIGPFGRPDEPPPLELAAAPVAEPAPEGPSFVLRGARVMTAAGDIIDPGDVWVRGPRIEAVGPGLGIIEDVKEIDASGKTITPGIIDTHSHMGVYPLPRWRSHADGNEAVRPMTAEVSAADGYWPQDPQLERARAGGVTAAQILPGSANLFGGRSFVVKLHPGRRSAAEARFEGAPEGMKMACGENPKRVYGEKGGPATRMGNVAGYRKALQQAVEYRDKWDRYERKRAKWQNEAEAAEAEGGEPEESPEPPARDFALEGLAGVLRGEVLVHNHCYRADEMSIMLDLAESFGFTIRSFHHAVEAYKIADRLAAAGTAASMWADWWGFKAEAYDGIRENAAMVHDAGARAIIHSDSGIGIQRLNQEAAKAMYAGRRAGIEISDDDALRWVTANPAWALGVDAQTGSLEAGKLADLVVWSGDPFSVYTRAEQVYIDGELVYDRTDADRQPRSDFEAGMRPGDLGGMHGEEP